MSGWLYCPYTLTDAKSVWERPSGLNWPSGATICLAVQPDMLPKWDKCEMVMLYFCSFKDMHSVWVFCQIVCFVFFGRCCNHAFWPLVTVVTSSFLKNCHWFIFCLSVEAICLLCTFLKSWYDEGKKGFRLRWWQGVGLGQEQWSQTHFCLLFLSHLKCSISYLESEWCWNCSVWCHTKGWNQSTCVQLCIVHTDAMENTTSVDMSLQVRRKARC